MSRFEALRNSLPELARDTKVNLDSVVRQPGGSLTATQRWGVAVAAAAASRHAELLAAVSEEAASEAGPAAVEDGLAAASLMAMNNVFYRFKHIVGNPAYDQKPARLRMQRLVKPATSKGDFELICLAVSAINGCEACVKAHETAVKAAGLTEDHVFDAVRVAAVISSAAVALAVTPFVPEAVAA